MALLGTPSRFIQRAAMPRPTGTVATVTLPNGTTMARASEVTVGWALRRGYKVSWSEATDAMVVPMNGQTLLTDAPIRTDRSKRSNGR